MHFVHLTNVVGNLFTAKPDGKKDIWSYHKMEGDCEDYVFSILWLQTEGKLAFYKEVLFGPYSFWFVKVGPDTNSEGRPINNGHMVLEYKPNKLMTDVIYLNTHVKEWYELKGFRFVKRYPKLYVILKLMLGATVYAKR